MNYFITIAELKKVTNINGNVNDNDIVPYLKLCYDKYLLSICDDNTISDTLTAYNNNTLSPSQIELLPYLKDVMLWSVAAEVIMNTTYAVKNKGVQKQNGDNSVEVDYAEMGSIRKAALTNVDMYRTRLEKYLCSIDVHCTNCSCKVIKSFTSMFFA